ncbi:glycosyltransferase [Nocardioides sp. CFH 31398]|nr:glycosyltransferase [Nocardioides sp. CFH 31398]
MTESNRGVVVFGVTVPVSATSFLRGQLRHLVQVGWDVQLLCGTDGLEEFAEAEGATLQTVRTARQPAPSDLVSLLLLWRRLRRIRPDVVVMSTPKMGVLGSLAAAMAGVPTRVYFILGHRAEGLSGPRRWVMSWLDRLACAAATEVVPVSEGLGQLLTSERIVKAEKIQRLPRGAATLAVDTKRFRVPSTSERARVREELGLDRDAPVVGFIGRLTRDKGLPALPRTWSLIHQSSPRATLLLVGTPEPVDADDRAALDALDSLASTVRRGHLERVETALKAIDVLVLLSNREGLGVVVLEAAACGVPTVAYRVTGVVDTIVDGTTGLLCRPGDTVTVANSVQSLLTDPQRRRSMGFAANSRVDDLFGPSAVWPAWDSFLIDRFGERRKNRGGPLGRGMRK